MKRLTLLRHAKSSWDQAGLDDHDRPLAERGRRDAPRIGERLTRRGLRPDLVLSSTALRARETAELVSAALGGGSRPKLALEPRIYLASPDELLAVLAGIDDAVGELVLVGHNPGLTELVNTLLPDLKLANLPTAGAVAIDCDTDRWQTIDAARFAHRFSEFPKK